MKSSKSPRPKTPSPAQRFLRKYPLTAPIAGSLLLVAGGATIFWWINRNTFTPGTLPVGANMIPQDALMVLTLNTDVQQWRQLRSYGTPKSQRVFDNLLVDWRDRLFKQNGIDYDNEIAPWVGPEVTIAQLSPQSELSDQVEEIPTSLSPQPMVAVLPIGDPLQAKQVLSQPKDLPDRQWSERTYKQIKIRESQPLKAAQPQSDAAKSDKSPTAPAPPLQLAVVENRVLLVTNSARSMNAAIDSFRDRKTSLASTPGYAQALGQIQQPVRPFLTFYRNVPGSIDSAAKNLDQPLAQKQQEWVNQAQGWATVANLQEDGIELRNIAWLKPDSKRKFAAKNNAKSLHNKLPSSSLAIVAGGNFEQFWQDYSRDYITYPIQPFSPSLFQKGVQDSVGLNWQNDFLKWMKGEFALALVPMPGEAAEKMPIGIMALVKTNDRRAAEKALQQLDNAMIGRQRYQVAPGKLNNQSVVNWSEPTTGTTVTRGWMDDNVAFIALGSPITGKFFPNPQTRLSDQPAFRRTALDPLVQQQSDANGFFFLNVEEIFALPQLPPLFSWLDPYRDWGEAVRSIGLNAVTSSDRTIRFDAFVQLKPGSAAGPLKRVAPPKPSEKSTDQE